MSYLEQIIDSNPILDEVNKVNKFSLGQNHLYNIFILVKTSFLKACTNNSSTVDRNHCI